MAFGSDLGSLLTLLGVALLAFVLLDLFVAGGCATGSAMSGIGGMMGGAAGAMGTPWGWGLLLLVVAAIVALLVGGPGLLPGL